MLALEGSRAYVGPRADLPFVPESAVQCQPLLVERDGQNGIHTDDGRRAARTTVCVTGGGESALHFVLFLAPPGEGPPSPRPPTCSAHRATAAASGAARR